jgi:hypothetical protein
VTKAKEATQPLAICWCRQTDRHPPIAHKNLEYNWFAQADIGFEHVSSFQLDRRQRAYLVRSLSG